MDVSWLAKAPGMQESRHQRGEESRCGKRDARQQRAPADGEQTDGHEHKHRQRDEKARQIGMRAAVGFVHPGGHRFEMFAWQRLDSGRCDGSAWLRPERVDVRYWLSELGCARLWNQCVCLHDVVVIRVGATRNSTSVLGALRLLPEAHWSWKRRARRGAPHRGR